MGFFRRWKSFKARRKPARRLLLEPLETRTLLALDLAAITGTAYVDLTGDGLTGDDTRINGATVELYRDDGDGIFNAGDALLGTATTNPSGVYRFASTNAGGLLAAGTLTAGDYFVRQLPQVGYMPPDAALVTLTPGHVNGTTVQTIDTFDVTEQLVTASLGTPVVGDSMAASEAIGGERDVLVTLTSGNNVSARINEFGATGVFAFESGLNSLGTILIQYDGIDGDATTLAATGLGGVNLSDGDPYAGLLLSTRGDAAGATAQLRVYTDASNYSTATINIPQQATVEEIFVPFSSFTPTGAGATFTSVGAIELFIDGVPELDAQVELVSSLRSGELTFDLENLEPGVGITKYTDGQDANTVGSGPYVAVGGTVTFTYHVVSTGGTPLQNVVVTDDNGTPGDTADDFHPTFTGGDTNGDGILDPTETWVYEYSHTVTAGQYGNIGSVVAEDLNGDEVTDTDPSHHFGATADIHVVKYTNGEDANSPTGPLLLIGSTATFTYVVTNTGNVPLSNVVVTDDNGTPGSTGDDITASYVGGDTNSNGLLDTTETWTFEATRLVTAGQHTNTGTATGHPVDPTGADINGLAEPTDSDPSNHYGVRTGISIVKSTNNEDANTPPGPWLLVGTTATFTYVVTNTGDTALTIVSITDDNGTPGNPADDFAPTYVSGDTNGNNRLDTTETWTYTATRTVTPGQHTNTATVVGNPVDDVGSDITTLAEVSASDPSNHFGVAAGIQVVKSTNGQDANSPPGPEIAAGSAATFTYVVTNTGSVALRSITLTDDNGTPGNPGDDFHPTFTGGDTNGNNLLDTTETWTYTATRTVTAGQYTNTATVTGHPVNAAGADIPGAPDATNTDVSNHFGYVGGIAITKLVNGIDTGIGTGPTLAIGSLVTFTYQVRNTGNIALTDIIVTDDNGTSGTTADDWSPVYVSGDTDGDGVLDVTETWVYTATRVVTAGVYSNTATVTGRDPGAALHNAADTASYTGVNRLSKRRFLASYH